MIADIISTKELIMLAFAAGGFYYGTRGLKSEISNLKKDFEEKINAFKNDIKEDILRLEKAQEKSNNVRERLAVAENAVKSAHHRIDDICKKEKK